MSEETVGLAEVVRDLTERLAAPQLLRASDGDFAVLPEGKKIHDMRAFHERDLARPRRRTGTSTHTTLASFVDHARRHLDESSVVFATIDGQVPHLVAIYDYHEPTRGGPRWCSHRASYSAPWSDEWLAWSRIAGPNAPMLSQRDFAEALEDRALEVLAPSAVPDATKSDAARLGIDPAGPTTVASLARGLVVRADRKVGSHTNLNTGEGRIVFEEQHTTSIGDAPVIVPTGFVVGVPIFRDGDARALIVRLRYKVTNEGVKWKVTIHRPDAAVRDAFNDVVAEVRDKTGLPVFFGAPEQ